MDKSIGNILREKRIEAGLSVKDISSRLTDKGYKASEKTIYSWESGNSQPSPEALLEMCDAYAIQDILSTFGYNGYKEDGSIQLNVKEQEHIEKYRSLDSSGQETVSYILDKEAKRVKTIIEQSARIAELESPEQKIVNIEDRKEQFSNRTFEYHRSVSAGGGVFMMDDEGVDQVAIPLETPGADKCDYLIKISGNSMEPDYYDGEVALVSRIMPVRHGDVGIFIVDGKAYIKEYGDAELISRNPSSENIKISEYANIVCMGKVVGKIREEDMVRK